MATPRCTECSTGSPWTNNFARCTTRARSSRRSCACRSASPATCSAEPHDVVQILPTPLSLGGVEVETVEIRHYGYDPTMAEPRKSSVAVLLKADYDFWDALAGNPEAYASEKQRILAAVTDLFSRASRGPRAASRSWTSPLRDLPAVHRQLAGVHRRDPHHDAEPHAQISKTLPGLNGFYQVGQWVQPGGGLPSGVMTGREVAQSICARDRHTYGRPRLPGPDQPYRDTAVSQDDEGEVLLPEVLGDRGLEPGRHGRSGGHREHDLGGVVGEAASVAGGKAERRGRPDR